MLEVKTLQILAARITKSFFIFVFYLRLVTGTVVSIFFLTSYIFLIEFYGFTIFCFFSQH